MRLSVIIVLAIALIYPVTGSAAVYRCKKNGTLTFSDVPCSDNAEVVPEQKLGRKSSNNDSWKFIDQTDEVTGRRSCFAKSPNFYLGEQGNEWLFASLRVGGTRERPVVLLRSEESFDPTPASFHTDIDGTGLKIGDNAFIPVSEKSGNYAIGYTFSESKTVLKGIVSSGQFIARLRFWPYEQTHDSPPTSFRGFEQAFSQASSCNSGG